jgi:hypothetical protein
MDAVSLGTAVLAFLVVEGAGIADGLAFLTASHPAEPTDTPFVKERAIKRNGTLTWGRWRRYWERLLWERAAHWSAGLSLRR